MPRSLPPTRRQLDSSTAPPSRIALDELVGVFLELHGSRCQHPKNVLAAIQHSWVWFGFSFYAFCQLYYFIPGVTLFLFLDATAARSSLECASSKLAGMIGPVCHPSPSSLLNSRTCSGSFSTSPSNSPILCIIFSRWETTLLHRLKTVFGFFSAQI